MIFILFLFIFTVRFTKESLISLMRDDFVNQVGISTCVYLDTISNFIAFKFSQKDLAPKEPNELADFYSKALNELQKEQMETFLKDEMVTLNQFKKDAIGAFRKCLVSDDSLKGDLREEVEKSAESWDKVLKSKRLIELKCFSRCLFLYELTLARGYASRAPEKDNISRIYKELVDLLVKLSPFEKERQEQKKKRRLQEEQKVQPGSIWVPIVGLTIIFVIAMLSITLGLKARENALEKENKGY